MRKNWGGALASLLLASVVLSAAAFGQGGGTVNTGLIFTNTNTVSNNPFVWFQDSPSDSGVVPVLEVSGGQTASTLGIEVTSQATTSTGTAPNLSTIMGTGFGGLSLVQTGLAGTNGPGVASPAFAMCANQYGSAGAGGQGPDCWFWQVQGGPSMTSDPPDILQLFRQTTTNKTSNLTVLFPAQINLATAAFTGTPAMAGQITVGPMPYGGANANVPATFTGASTSSILSGAAAGPAIIQPGQLTATTPNSTSTEGALELMQTYLGTNNSGSNYNLLACPDTTTAQGVVVCGTPHAAAQVVGVYNNNPQQAGATITPIRYGRAQINNFGSAATWTSGDYVCVDLAHNGYVLDPNNLTGINTPCPAGQAVGVAVGDTSTTSSNTHAVDLTIAPVPQGGALMTFFCGGSITAGSTLYVFPGALQTACNLATGTTGIVPVSFAGTLKNMEVFYATPTGGTGMTHTDTFTVWKCAALAGCTAMGITCQISGTTSPATCSDLTHTVSLSQGDGIQIVDVTGSMSGAANPRISIEFQ